LQDIQFHPVSEKILHVDFYQLFDDKEITMNIPVKLEGTSPGVLNGGSLRFTNRKLKVKALPANLPDFVTANISKLKIGNKLFVTSLFNDDYTFMHPDNTVVVQVRTSRNATLTEDEEEITEEATEEAAAE
jgi:large subunit ribosomal protein L25